MIDQTQELILASLLYNLEKLEKNKGFPLPPSLNEQCILDCLTPLEIESNSLPKECLHLADQLATGHNHKIKQEESHYEQNTIFNAQAPFCFHFTAINLSRYTYP